MGEAVWLAAHRREHGNRILKYVILLLKYVRSGWACLQKQDCGKARLGANMEERELRVEGSEKVQCHGMAGYAAHWEANRTVLVWKDDWEFWSTCVQKYGDCFG